MVFALSQAVGYAAGIALAFFTGPKLEVLIMKAGLSRFQPPPRAGAQRYGKDELVASTVYGAVAATRKGDAEAADGLKAFVQRWPRSPQESALPILLRPYARRGSTCAPWMAQRGCFRLMSRRRRLVTQ